MAVARCAGFTLEYSSESESRYAAANVSEKQLRWLRWGVDSAGDGETRGARVMVWERELLLGAKKAAIGFFIGVPAANRGRAIGRVAQP